MKRYKNILLAVELNGASDKRLIAQAKSIAEAFGAKINLIHVIEHFAGYGATYGVAVGAELEGVLLDRARIEMEKLATKLGVPQKNCVIDFGMAKEAILEEADKRKIDLIMLGSHGRRGLQLLIGSTANAVLHGAKCDVLAVRFKK